MSRWFRHYAGLCRDEKLVSSAIKAKQPIERVVWVWCAILESAAEVDDNGRYDLDTAEVAYFLRADQGDIDAIVGALEASGRVFQNTVVKWGNRQFSSDRSRDRVAAHRDRKRSENMHSDDHEASRNDDVTLQKRHCNSPETETELDTDKKDTSLRSVSSAGAQKSDLKPRKLPEGEAILFDLGCPESLISDWKAVRKAKNAGPITKTVVDALGREARLAGLSVESAVRTACERGWQGFKADWVARAPPQRAMPGQYPAKDTMFDALDRILPDDTDSQAIASSVVFQLPAASQRFG